MEHSQSTIDVRGIMREIQEKLRPVGAKGSGYVPHLEGHHRSPVLSNIDALEQFVEDVRQDVGQVGSMPPCPPTLRARVGSKIVLVLQRALFWYTDQLHRFHLKVSRALDEQCTITRSLLESVSDLQSEVGELKRSVALPAPETPQSATAGRAAGAAASSTSGDAELRAAVLKLAEQSQRLAERLRLEICPPQGSPEAAGNRGGTEAELPAKAARQELVDLPEIRRSLNQHPGATVVRLGAPADWVELLRRDGIDAHDMNGGGADTREPQALPRLRALADSSVAAVICRNVVEQLPVTDLKPLIEESFRVLKSGGVLLLEATDPRRSIYASGLSARNLAWLMEATGFQNARVHYTCPAGLRDGRASQKPWSELVQDLSKEPEEVAVIGEKPARL